VTSANIALAILAAGAASRFGGGKLEAPLGDDLVGLVTARRLAGVRFAAKVAICNPADRLLIKGFSTLGFAIIDNEDPAAGLSRSIALAAEAALALGVDGLMIALADMPNLTALHIYAMIDAFAADAEARSVATSCAGAISPPALFASRDFGALGALSGQEGAKAMLSRATLIEADAWIVADIDTRDDLIRISRSYQLSTKRCRDPS
jgi:molybdenum cofactor cytidylyltransferase